MKTSLLFFFFFSSRRRHTRSTRDWSSDVCSSDLDRAGAHGAGLQGDDDGAPVQPPAAERGGGRAHGDQLGVGGGVGGFLPAVAATAEDGSVLAEDHAPDRNVLVPERGPGLVQRQPHPGLVGSRVGGPGAQRPGSWSVVVKTRLVAIAARA